MIRSLLKDLRAAKLKILELEAQLTTNKGYLDAVAKALHPNWNGDRHTYMPEQLPGMIERLIDRTRLVAGGHDTVGPLDCNRIFREQELQGDLNRTHAQLRDAKNKILELEEQIKQGALLNEKLCEKVRKVTDNALKLCCENFCAEHSAEAKSETFEEYCAKESECPRCTREQLFEAKNLFDSSEALLYAREDELRQLRAIVAEPKTSVLAHNPDTCRKADCLWCGWRDCSHAEPLHYDKDGCPVCKVRPDATLEDLATVIAERDRLLKLFHDAGQGEHNVLALIDHYQDEAFEAERKVDALRDQLALAEKVVDATNSFQCACDVWKAEVSALRLVHTTSPSYADAAISEARAKADMYECGKAHRAAIEEYFAAKKGAT